MQRAIAYLLVFHGSRDIRPQQSVEVLTQLFAQRIQHPEFSMLFSSEEMLQTSQPYISLPFDSSDKSSLPSVAIPIAQPGKFLVRNAALECGPLPLHAQIEQLGKELQAIAEISDSDSVSVPIRLQVLPLFLLPGVHVMEDIPAEIHLAHQALGPSVEIEVLPYLGSHAGLLRVVTERMAALPVEAWILLAHGSRRAGANDAIEALADRLGAVTAYWAVAPNLESRLQELIQLGFRKLAILPFFLFSGGITDAIAQTVESLSHQFPDIDLHLASPLEASPELADLLVDLCRG